MLAANMDKNSDDVYTSVKASLLIEELNNRHRNAANNTNNITNKLKINTPVGIGGGNKVQPIVQQTKPKQYTPPPPLLKTPPPSASPLPTQPAQPQQQQPAAQRHDDRWIQIQKNTFTNWINEQLKSEPEKVLDLKQDLTSGVVLIKLVNALQKQNTRVVTRKFYKSPQNQHQCLENISFALNAITEDGVKMVNIGNTDLYNGNLKLMLGLVWHLILRYQIGKTKVPAKKLILAWMNAILPQNRLGNLTSDLNNGQALA
jgi:hypothetical protein